MELGVSVAHPTHPPWCSLPGAAMEVLVHMVSTERCTSSKFRQVCAAWRHAHDVLIHRLQVKRCAHSHPVLP